MNTTDTIHRNSEPLMRFSFAERDVLPHFFKQNAHVWFAFILINTLHLPLLDDPWVEPREAASPAGFNKDSTARNNFSSPKLTNDNAVPI